MAIFVIHSRLNQAAVKALVQGLEVARLDVWFDNDLSGGEMWWIKILERIRHADLVIFALSDSALRSKPCRAELEYAMALDRTILPIKVGPVANFRANPLSHLQTIEFQPGNMNSAFEITATIQQLTVRYRPLPEVLPPEPHIPFHYLISLANQIDNQSLSPEAQLDAVDQLRKAYRKESDESVQGDIVAILRNLKAKPWATVQCAHEADALLAWIRDRTPSPTGGSAYVWSSRTTTPQEPDDSAADAPDPQPEHVVVSDQSEKKTDADAESVGFDPVAPGRIFISYRRMETAYPTGWLYERLADHFGRDDIVRDIDSIEPGDDFVEVIGRAVASCDLMLVIIGTRWLTITDIDGRRRLDDPEDFVRREIEAALQRNIRVIPILIDGATMPRSEQLPSTLAKLSRRQAVDLDPLRFRQDVDRLLRVLDRVVSESHARR